MKDGIKDINLRKKLVKMVLRKYFWQQKSIMGRNMQTLLDEDITILYNDLIIPAYNSELKKIHKNYFNNGNVEVAIFINSETNSYEIITVEEHNFEFIKKSMDHILLTLFWTLFHPFDRYVFSFTSSKLF